MIPSAADRDALFKTFGRAWFRRDIDLLYQSVTEDFVWASLDGSGAVCLFKGKDAVGEALRDSVQPGIKRTFEDVAYHHAADASFMTFRLIDTEEKSGNQHVSVGVERYTFRDGRIAIKDVYRKTAAV